MYKVWWGNLKERGGLVVRLVVTIDKNVSERVRVGVDWNNLAQDRDNRRAAKQQNEISCKLTDCVLLCVCVCVHNS